MKDKKKNNKKKRKEKYHTVGIVLKSNMKKSSNIPKRVIRSRKSKKDMQYNGQKDKQRSTKH